MCSLSQFLFYRHFQGLRREIKVYHVRCRENRLSCGLRSFGFGYAVCLRFGRVFEANYTKSEARHAEGAGFFEKILEFSWSIF